MKGSTKLSTQAAGPWAQRWPLKDVCGLHLRHSGPAASDAGSTPHCCFSSSPGLDLFAKPSAATRKAYLIRHDIKQWQYSQRNAWESPLRLMFQAKRFPEGQQTHSEVQLAHDELMSAVLKDESKKMKFLVPSVTSKKYQTNLSRTFKLRPFYLMMRQI